MDVIRVKSSQISAIAHDSETGVLRIYFRPYKEGGEYNVYDYAGVPVEEFERLRDAESIGSHFANTIKKQSDVFPFTKLAEEAYTEAMAEFDAVVLT